MTDKPEFRRVAFAVPERVAEAAETIARQDLTSVSYVCRRALVNELRERGLLNETA